MTEDSTSERLARMEGKLDVVLTEHSRRLNEGDAIHASLHSRITDLKSDVVDTKARVGGLEQKSVGTTTKVLALIGALVAVLGFGFTIFSWIMEH